MDEIWKRNEVDSPCVQICVIHKRAGICIGCNRTKEEIASWSEMTGAERENTIRALPARTQLLRNKRRDGHKGHLARQSKHSES